MHQKYNFTHKLLDIVPLGYLDPILLMTTHQHVSYGAHQPDAQKCHLKIRRHPSTDIHYTASVPACPLNLILPK